MANLVWHSGEVKEAEIKAIATDYEEAAERLLEERDAKLRAAISAGWKQADVVRITGYSREAIRQALNPEIRAQLRARRAAKRPVGGEETNR
jgi:enamine deaminase RidA (YjgF/YER057c/UK114 family)